MAGVSNEILFTTARQNRLFGQLIPNQINDLRILNAMNRVAREKFLPERLGSCSYADETIYVNDQMILFSPRILARLLLAADLNENDFVLNVKSGSGYSAAVIANMTKAVVALENDPALCETAQQILIDSEIDNVAVINRDPDEGFPSQGPFDVIFIEGIVSRISEKLLAQLAENGRLICVMSQNTNDIGHATKIVKHRENLTHSVLFDVDLSGSLSNRSYKRFVFETVS